MITKAAQFKIREIQHPQKLLLFKYSLLELLRELIVSSVTPNDYLPPNDLKLISIHRFLLTLTCIFLKDCGYIPFYLFNCE